MMAGCESHDGFLRFYAKRKPDEDIKGQVILFRKGGVPPTGDIEAGDGLAFGADGKLAVKIGDGLMFDENRAVATDPQTVVTDSDMVNEDEAEASLREILLNNAPDGADESGM